MPDLIPTPGLAEIGPDVHAWLQAPAGHGYTNAAVVVDDDGITVVDTLLTPAHAEPLFAAVEALGRPIRRVIYSSSHIEFTGGSSRFWMAARYGREHTSAILDQPPNPVAWSRLHPDHAEAFDELATRPVSHTVDTAVWLTPTLQMLPVTGQQEQNLVGWVPEQRILLAGAMCSFGVTPLAFDGDPGAWADSLGGLSELADVIVPGIGPVGDADDLLALQAYLYACVDAEGDPTGIPPGPWDDWPDRHFDEVNIERAAMLAAGDDGAPPSMLRLLGLATG